MKQTAKAGKAITVSALELQVLDLTDRIEQLEATRATHEDVAFVAGQVDKHLAGRVPYGAPVLAVRRRASRWSWLFGGSRHTEVVVELRKVTLQ